MKQVFDTDEVPHLWANKTQERARNPGGNFFYEGASIYSYGRHFEVGRHVEHKGRSAVLLNTRGYSNTTAKHKHAAAMAVRHLTVFRVDLELRTPAEWFADYQERYLRFLSLAGKTRKNTDKRANAFADAGRTAKEANALAEFYGMRSRIKHDAASEAAMLETLAQHEAAKSRAEKRMAAKMKKEMRENLAAWRAGERDALGYHENTYFRFIADGEEVQTSHGARFHAKDAKLAYRALRAIHAKGETFHANGKQIKVGPWEVNDMDAAGNVRAGCHRIEWAEIEGFATAAGWNE